MNKSADIHMPYTCSMQYMHTLVKTAVTTKKLVKNSVTTKSKLHLMAWQVLRS